MTKTIFPLDKLFLEKDNYPAHSAIASGNNPIVRILERRDDRGLTPLAVAAMAGNKTALRNLIRQGANLLPLDNHKWTPLHYARINGDAEVEKIIRKAAQDRKLTLPDMGEIDRLLGPTQAQVPLAFSLEFPSLTGGAIYREEPQATPESLVNYWLYEEMREQICPELGREKVEESFDRSRDKKAPLELLVSNSGLDVVASEDISEGDCIGVHGGKFNPENPSQPLEDHSDRFEELDASEIKNLPSMIPDGLPNCIVNTIYKSGIPYHVFIATRKIKKGEPIRINFSFHHEIKYSYQTFPEGTLREFEGDNILTIFSELLGKKKLTPISLLHRSQKLIYLFSTPFFFLELLIQDRINLKNVLVVLKDPRLNLGIPKDLKPTFEMYLEVWGKLKAHLKTFSPQVSQRIRETLAEYIRTNPLTSVIRFLNNLPNHLNEIVDEESWSRVSDLLNQNNLAFDILYRWKEEKRSELEADYAIRLMHPLDRTCFIEAFKVILSEKQKRILEILSVKTAISEWIKSGKDKVEVETCQYFHRLHPKDQKELYSKFLPHIKQRHPDLLATFNDYFTPKSLESATPLPKRS